MLRRLDEMRGFTIRAVDGEIGHVSDFYFDESDWMVRYVVVNTGSWLFGRKVLLSPHCAQPPNWLEEILPVELTMEQVENSPDIDLDRPVSRQHEIALHSYYGWPAYWAGGAMMGGPVTPMYPGVPPAGTIPPDQAYPAEGDIPATPEDEAAMTDEDANPYLHSTKEVVGYTIQATDGEIGHLEDFFASETEWNIHYAMVDTGTWLPGRKVLIMPRWIEDVNWEESKIFINHTRDQVKESPEFDPKRSLDRSYETRYHDYYGYPYYWL
jgi:hypothetical protein